MTVFILNENRKEFLITRKRGIEGRHSAEGGRGVCIEGDKGVCF